MSSFQFLLPELTLVVFALIVLLLDLVIKKHKQFLAYFSLAGLIVPLFFIADMMTSASIFEHHFDNALGTSLFNDMLRIDEFSLLFKLVFLFVAIIVVLASINYVEKEPGKGEYYFLLLIATTGMMVVACSSDLITLFIGLETASVSTYVLAGFRKKNKKSTEAALKYFIIGALSSAFALYGISLIYGIAGTTNIEAIRIGIITGSEYQPLIIVAIVCLVAGFGFKIAAVPFHMWAPDVYEGAPTTITSFLAAGSKKMGFAALFKIFLVGLISIKSDWQPMLALLAILTMTIGNILAIQQRNIKRMLAYSSIAQAGYIMIALVVATPYALAGGLFYVLTHAVMKGGAFIVVCIVSLTLLSDRIDDYKGLGKRSPLVAFCFMLLLLSLAGIPFLAGFWSKFVLFASAVQAGNWFVWLAVAGVLNSALSLYYYARIIKYMYVNKAPDETQIRLPFSITLAVLLTTAAVIVIGIYPEPVISWATDAARVLLP